MSDHTPPDFAMVRAVEILASIATGARSAPIVPPPPIDRPVILFNEMQAFEIGKTTRQNVEKSLGTGYPFPGKGWHTYAVRGHAGRRLLSVVYNNDVLSGAEFYVPKGDSVPALAPRNFGDFRLIPGEISLGKMMRTLDARYTQAVGGPGQLVYAQIYEIRFPGGLGYVMGNEGLAERLALYTAP
ncbi:MAG: hypothetical protein WCE44_13815 [Candidatus Velthaea sp.]|jgi:hypothetical protein